jgi:hypothetical protein
MYITVVPNRGSRPAVLLRESYRDNGKVKNRTLANLTDWPLERVNALRELLRGHAPNQPSANGPFEIVSSRPHGHVAAILGTLRKTQLLDVFDASTRTRALVEAMIVSRLIRPRSKLGLSRDLRTETRTSSLGEVLGLDGIDEDDLYAAMDVLGTKQAAIESALAKRYLREGGIALYDVSSTYLEGRTCSLAKIGYSRDGKRNSLQIVFGLLTTMEGCPVAVDVFEGNVGDPSTLPAQVKRLREQFGVQRVVLVGDRGMITEARIRENLAGLDGVAWITSLRSPAIQALVQGGSLQLGLFDEHRLAEITDPEYPGERLVVCKNPRLAEERARKREDLLAATEKHLAKVVAATTRSKNRLSGAANIGLRVGKVLERYNVAKHFIIEISNDHFTHQRNQTNIRQEAALDGIYVVRTSVPRRELDENGVVRAYKSLSTVERAFRCMKGFDDLALRPVHHRKAERVRAHVFLCMLAYHVEWHLRRTLAPMLFQDDAKADGEKRRESVVDPARRSRRADKKASTKRTVDGTPVHTLRSLLDYLATLTRNRIQPKTPGLPAFDMLAKPTTEQARALQLLGVNL